MGHSFRLLKEERPKLQFFFTFPTKTITDTMAHLARIANMNCSRSIISQWSKSPLLAQQAIIGSRALTTTAQKNDIDSALSSLVQELPPLESQDLVLVLDLSSVPSLSGTPVIHH